MKRVYKQAQGELDRKLSAAISNGTTDENALMQIVRHEQQCWLLGDVQDTCMRVEWSQAKQRLRKAGLIELTVGNRPVLIADITADDAEFIDERRRIEIAGKIKSRCVFNTLHDRPDQAAEAKRQLEMFDDVDIAVDERLVPAEPITMHGRE